MNDLINISGGYFFLNEDHTYRVCHLMEWANQIEEMHKNNTKHVADEMVNDKRVSTVWLGLDHQCGEDSPLLFETMVFSDKSYNEIYMDRYTTWDQAVEGHKKAVQWVLDGCKDDE